LTKFAHGATDWLSVAPWNGVIRFEPVEFDGFKTDDSDIHNDVPDGTALCNPAWLKSKSDWQFQSANAARA
jgi:hypothetical protein